MSTTEFKLRHPEAEDYEYYKDSLVREVKETGMHKVFVYGTLLKGKGNNHLMGDSRLLYQASTVEDFVMYGMGFPLARPAVDTDPTEYVGRVGGEVWEVTEAVLSRLDRLEGHPNFYRRTLTPVFPYPMPSVWMYHWVSGKSIFGEQHKPDANGMLYWPVSLDRLKQERKAS